ncbi:conserved domain protein [delta proteobacterium NaphS2]|nr:conserved domain protein [delta proteobacterium NaphS2]
MYRIRQKESLPVLDDLKKWLPNRPHQAPPKELLGTAISYILYQWDRLVGDLEDGYRVRKIRM